MAKNKLTKADIIDQIYENNKISRKDIHRIIDFVFEGIKKGLSEDKVVELRGFGTFEIRLRKGRQRARNPKTGEVFPVQNHGVPIFRPGQELKQIAWPMRQ
jgi:integration host factor subunit beta